MPGYGKGSRHNQPSGSNPIGYSAGDYEANRNAFENRLQASPEQSFCAVRETSLLKHVADEKVRVGMSIKKEQQILPQK